MIYRETKRTVKGTVNRSCSVTHSKHVQIHAESLADLERWLRETPKKWTSDSAESDSTRSQDWDLNAGYSGASKMAKEGWTEGANDLNERLQAILPAAGRESRYGHSVYGSSVNIGRYLNGNPNNMRRRGKREAGSAPVFHIVINTSASCAVNAEHMKNYGVAIVGLIDRLEATGKRCMVDICNVGSYENGWRGSYGWTVKQASEHIDLSAVAFSIAHPAAFRRLGFAMMERMPAAAQSWGYGQCADILPVDVADHTDGMMLLDGVNHEPRRCSTPEGALRLAVEQLNKAAVLAGHCTVEQPLIDEDDLFADGR